MEPVVSAEERLADQTDADLLETMSLAQADPAEARDAWEVFYRRHATYLYAVCLRAYGDLLGGEAGAADLVADTFGRAYEHAATFDAAGATDADGLGRQVRAWLGRIAQRLMLSALRRRGRFAPRFLAPEHWANVPQRPATADEADDARIEAVRRALGQLNEAEQLVLRTTFQWYQVGRPHQRLPNDVAADLAATLETTPENLRQIRRRALRKVEAILRQAAVTAEEDEP
ncbi:MAG: sigma-70 family RNA polymerase sigma factor [Planctomycetes bacterium]|nr:sigma-70 family RNA polymerase sigma factor [Planctomycetota bacterium]